MIGIYNILYIFEKLSFMPFRKLSAHFWQHMKKSDYCKNLANLNKPCIKSSHFFLVWLQAFQKAITCFFSAI